MVSSIWAAGSAIDFGVCAPQSPEVHSTVRQLRSVAPHRISHCRRSRCCRRSPTRIDHLCWTQLQRPCCRGGRPTTGEPAGLFEAGQHPGRTQSADGVPEDLRRIRLRGSARPHHRQAGPPHRQTRRAEPCLGYTCFNDGSIRDIQFKHSIAAGKNFHATGGFGPWIVTADEIPDPTRLRLVTRLNGKEVQHTGIDDLIFDIPTLISYCSDWTRSSPATSSLPAHRKASGSPASLRYG